MPGHLPSFTDHILSPGSLLSGPNDVPNVNKLTKFMWEF